MPSINCSICGYSNRYAESIPARCIDCSGFLRNDEKKEEKKKIPVPIQWSCNNCTYNNGNTIACTECTADRPPSSMRWICICGHNESHLSDKCTGCFKHAKNASNCPICDVPSDNILYDCTTRDVEYECTNTVCRTIMRDRISNLATSLIEIFLHAPVRLSEAEKEKKRIQDAEIRKELREKGAFKKYEREIKNFTQEELKGVCSICQENLADNQTEQYNILVGHDKCWFHKDCFDNYCDNEQFKNGFKCALCSDFDFVKNL
jgi:hypothetical protein